ncbi:MAG: VPLPA-CTERM sorting domain-containing protein [Pseudomonadota bacterium]
MKLFQLTALIAMSSFPAAAITVTESGDFSGDFSAPTSIGTLDLGENTASGSLNGVCAFDSALNGANCRNETNSSDVSDFLSFVIPVGLEAFDAGIFMEGEAPTLFSYSADIFTPDLPPVVLAGDFYAMNAGGSFVESDGVLPAGSYVFGISAATFALGTGDWSGSWNGYITTRAVDNGNDGGDAAVIPLPAGAPLILGGLAALGLVKRRRRT